MPHPTPSPAPISAAEQIDIDHARAVLHNLIDLGTEMAQLAHQHALTQGINMARDPGPHHKYIDFTLGFERAARCVRRCIILRMKLHEPRPTGYDVALAAQNRAAAQERALNTTDTPERPERPEGLEQVERIDRLDRLDDDNFQDLDRPLGEIIAEICADLRIAPPEGFGDWAQRTPNELTDPPEPTRQEPVARVAATRPHSADPPSYPLRL